MKRRVIATVVLSICTGTVWAGTAINCHEIENMEASAVETCVEQTDRHLNENYQILLKKFKEDAKLLKDMQLGWIKMRDAQCELAGKHTGSQAALVMSKCTVVLTQKRADELEKIADALFFAW